MRFIKEKSYYSMKHLQKKDFSLPATKLIEQIIDPKNVKQYYQSYIKRKNKKSIKQSKIITYQPKSFEDANIDDIKLVTIEHPKTSHKWSETIKQAGKVGSDSVLYIETKKK